VTWDDVKRTKRKLSREQGAIFKDWGGRIPIALIYPNSYYLGMSNLGFQTIYSLLNRYDKIVCERVFPSWQWNQSRKRRDFQPLSLESQRPLSDFAILAFSISYELDYFNVVQLLKDGGIPLLAADRDRRHPLLIAGGPCITANPEPLSPFFDCFAIGEGEAILPRLIEVLAEGIQSKREELLEGLSQVPGVYMPNFDHTIPVSRQWLRNLDDFSTTSVVLTPDTELGDLYLMEISRGCGWGCRFCLTGFQFRPMRSRSQDNLLEQATAGQKYRKRLGLVGAAVSDHPQIDELVSGLKKMGADISVSSLRIHPLSPVVLRMLAESATRTVALAPEAGSERLRQVINKGISEEDILQAVSQVASQGIRQLKLYFMIGLPTETNDDIEQLIKLALACKDLLNRQHGGSQMTINITPFVPKAGTPFQWLPMISPDNLDHRLSVIRATLRQKGIEIKSESTGRALVQGVLARGDSKLGAALARMSDYTLSGWQQAMEYCNLNSDFYALRQLPLSEMLPWSALDSGVATEYLEHELTMAQQCQECQVY